APPSLLGRHHRAAAVDGPRLGPARHCQSGPRGPCGLAVVHRLPDRLRARRRHRGGEGAPTPPDDDLAAGRAGRPRPAATPGARPMIRTAALSSVALVLALALAAGDTLPGQ